MTRTHIGAARWAGVVALVVVAWFIGGLAGGAAAIGGIALGSWRGPKAVAAASLAALVVTAVLTLVEEEATGKGYTFDFARDRTLAAVAGRVAGVLLLVAVGLAADRERTRRPDAAPADDDA